MKHLILRFTYFVFLFPFASIQAQKLALSSFASGLSSPIDIKNAGDNRLFVAERAGRIRVVNENGSVRPVPLLDITSKVSSTGCEEGLLGIAFSPTHKTDRKLYVNYTDSIGGLLFSIIEEYKVSTTDSNLVDPSSALELLRVQQPYCNHNGGNMMFGRDGMLYIALGDGGAGGDPLNAGQDLNTFLGKILRVDIRNSSVAQPYEIPSSNPYFSNPSTSIKKEIWSYGLRNPFRSSVDRITGDLWIGDVGQGAREEIDFEPFNTGGRNYGWRVMEGTQCYNPSTGCNTSGLQLPIYDYGRSNGYSVTGGYVHRSVQSKFLFGMYLFSDFGFQWIDGFRQTGGALSGSVTRLLPGNLAPGGPVGYGEDWYGDLYMAFNNVGTIYKISDTSYLRIPKAYFTAQPQSGAEFLFNGLRGRNVTYQWLKDGVAIAGATAPDYLANANGNYQLVLTNEIGNSDTSDIFSLTTLAVSLLEFNARVSRNDNVNLSWITSSELNSKGFYIERRIEGERDFITLTFINTKAINGNSSSPLTYEFVDAGLVKGSKIYYRLKIVDLQDRNTFSGIRSVRLNNANGYTIFPNPAKGSTTISLDDISLPARLNLYDAKGRLVRTEIITQLQHKLNLNDLRGIYSLEIYSRSEFAGSSKLIVQ